MDSDTLFNLFSDAKPHIKITTIREYSNRLSNLCDELNFTKTEDLYDFKKVIDHLETKRMIKFKKTGKETHTNTANIISSILEYLIIVDADAKVYYEYRTIKTIKDDMYQKLQRSGKLVGTQEENFIPLKELLEYYQVISDQADKLKTNEYINLRLLLRLYLNHPSRNEYSTLEFIKLREYNKIPKDKRMNYLVVPSNKPIFLAISDYKMTKKYGEKITFIKDPILKKLVKKQLKQNGFNAVFMNNEGARLQNSAVSQLFIRYSLKHLGKNIGSTLIYKIVNEELGKKYNSALDNNDIDEAKKIAAMLSENARVRGHSKAVQKDIYLKDSSMSD